MNYLSWILFGLPKMVVYSLIFVSDCRQPNQTISAIIKKFLKLGYVTFTESETDRRNKIIRFTSAGYAYAEKIIPAAADAEISAMAELAKKENVAELIRLTTLFSNLMKKKFDELK